jgi:hypothetical protein
MVFTDLLEWPIFESVRIHENVFGKIHNNGHIISFLFCILCFHTALWRNG